MGSGAFGRVLKADAQGILPNEPVTTVAVKMIKPHAEESHFKALLSELKVMVHLGRHVNVVNLLGACTKNIDKRRKPLVYFSSYWVFVMGYLNSIISCLLPTELLVIVEYCKYGSILNYLHRHKETFINQLDPETGNIDPNKISNRDYAPQISEPG